MLNALRYLEPLIGLLCFLWFSLASLYLYLKGSIRERQRKAEMLLGLCGMSFCGLRLYGVARGNLHDLRLARVFLAGATIGIFVTLVFQGSFNPFKNRGGKSGQPEPPQR